MNKKAKELTKNLSDKSGIYALKHNEKIIFIGVAFNNTKLTVNQLINRLKRNDNTQLKLKEYYEKHSSEIQFIQLEVCNKEVLKDRSDYFKDLYKDSLIKFYKKNNSVKKAVDEDISSHLSVYKIAALYKRNVESVRRAIRKSSITDNNLRKSNKTLLYSKEYAENLFGIPLLNSLVEDIDKPIYIIPPTKELNPINQKSESNHYLNQSIINEFSKLEGFKNWIVKIFYNLSIIFRF